MYIWIIRENYSGNSLKALKAVIFFDKYLLLWNDFEKRLEV